MSGDSLGTHTRPRPTVEGVTNLVARALARRTIETMSTLSQAENCEALTLRLEASDSVTDRLNGSLLRSVESSVLRHLGVGMSNRRLLFVPREKIGTEKSYLLTSFIGNDTYEFILVSQGAMQREDRCSSAIRVEVLSGFLNDLIALATPEPEETSEDVEAEPVEDTPTPTPQPAAEPQAALPDGWIMPSPSEFL
jgi:hypothetical protein